MSSNAPNGLYHFGFEVENGEKIVERLKKVNPNKLPKAASQRPALRRDPHVPISMATTSISPNMVFENVVPVGEKKIVSAGSVARLSRIMIRIGDGRDRPLAIDAPT